MIKKRCIDDMCLFSRLSSVYQFGTINFTSKTVRGSQKRLFLSNLLINWLFLSNDSFQTGFSFTEQRFGRYKSFYVSFIDY